MKLAKKVTLIGTLFSATLLTACTATNNTLTFTTHSPTTSFTQTNQNAILNIVVKDNRSRPEVSSYTQNGELVKLSASPDVTSLFRQVLFQDLNAKGFRIGNAQNSNTNVVVSINDFYGEVSQGNLSYKVNSKVRLDIHVQTSKGSFTKNLGATRSDEGAFTARNSNIHKSLSAVLDDIVTAIHRDQEVANAIRQYSN